ncbi:hypothetical protein ACFV9D_11015 [Streptomyces sp. NPDC059875]|uniref:hypothetical protein n=1 Tax=unclassified Streptomyces TaxID=2593676 RepID=UPI00365CD472
MTSLHISRTPAAPAPHPLRRVTDWPTAESRRRRPCVPSRRPTSHPARRATDRLSPAVRTCRSAVRRPRAAARRRRSRTVRARAADNRRDGGSDGSGRTAKPADRRRSGGPAVLGALAPSLLLAASPAALRLPHAVARLIATTATTTVALWRFFARRGAPVPYEPGASGPDGTGPTGTEPGVPDRAPYRRPAHPARDTSEIGRIQGPDQDAGRDPDRAAGIPTVLIKADLSGDRVDGNFDLVVPTDRWKAAQADRLGTSPAHGLFQNLSLRKLLAPEVMARTQGAREGWFSDGGRALAGAAAREMALRVPFVVTKRRRRRTS